uniref:NADH-ubiquinone oxidoreductase chain 1 n=1 Tax=Pholcus phalangioides TaxID=6932 RepID=L7NVY6_PHOPA|nr:NADH dehydrogenase subunit 1 [Pholcus phalangioides]AFC77894.1 NADH dehydrogenase subunit 1 [Pholcus phalangioides]
MMLLSILLVAVSMLIAVAFFTILERKFLSYSQIRKGPNKVSMLGVLQPIADAMKLLTKSQQNMESSNMDLSFYTPMLALLTSLIIFPIIPLSMYPLLDNNFNMILFLVVSSMMVYVLLSIGWSSNSKYSHMGAIRTVAQMISYEISFFLLTLNIMLMAHSFNTTLMKHHQSMLWFIMGMIPLFIVWIISCSAEVNRTPFDFAEGESELVSGFNVEYSGGHFALIFLAEYASIILMSLLTSILFCPLFIMPPIMALIFLWLRATLPRFRYDMLMNLNWKMFLPFTLLVITPMFTAAML